MNNEVLSQASVGAPADEAERAAQAATLDPELAATLRRLAAEGTVLLRNEPDAAGTRALPLQAGAPLALFGRVQRDWIAVGYGSGGDVNAPYITSLAGALAEAGVKVDEELAALYARWCEANPVDPGTEWGKWPLSFPEMPLEDEQVRAAAERATTAVVVIGRAAGEDRESLLEPGSFYLTADERRLLEQVRGAFTRVVAIVVTGNVIDLAWAEELGVDALLLAWCGGMEGGRAVADVLTGAAEPGGRLTDTIARRYEDYPSAGHFGNPEANEYAEDVFVGYRYFETFAPKAVLYPFGFGLGYSEHSIEGLGAERTDDGLSLSLRVTNTGARPGSTVAQVYVAKPSGADEAAGLAGLSQPARELVAFQRTEILEAGQSEELSLTIPWRRLASYDDSGATGHRFAWVLPAGELRLFAGANVREAAEFANLTFERSFVIEQLEQAAAPVVEFQRMARSASGELTWEPVPTSEEDLRERVLDRLPEELPSPADATTPTFAQVVAGEVSLEDFVATLPAQALAELAYGDIVMDSHWGVPGNAGALGGCTPTLRERGIPAAVTTDGPSGLRVAAIASLLPCGTALASTWDPEAIEEMAALHGEEMYSRGSDILLSPGMNIHRDPLCGRNFEYYSEDPLIAGECASAIVAGVQSTGKAACPKHFAANNQETARFVNDSRVSERALREIYLRGFEIMVSQAAPKVLMTSYNKVNSVWSHYNYDLVTTILREEWGYEGLVVTDWWMQMAPDPNFEALRDSAYRIRGGIDVLMPGGEKHFATTRDDAIMDSFGREGGITLAEMQQVALHVLRFLVGQEREGALAHAERAE